jgi:hypothetical protein
MTINHSHRCIAIAITITIAITKNHPTIPPPPPIPFVAYKFSLTFLPNIKRKIYNHCYHPIAIMKQTLIDHCHCCCHCSHCQHCHCHPHRHCKKNTSSSPSFHFLHCSQILSAFSSNINRKIYYCPYHLIAGMKQTMKDHCCCHFHPCCHCLCRCYHHSHCQTKMK